VHRARHRALLVLVGLAHVEQERTLVDQGLGPCGVDLADLRLGRLEQLTEVRHG
jgi:hypothetical protein